MTTSEPRIAHSSADEVAHDLALSFAGEQRAYVRDVAAYLCVAGLRIFFDEEEEARLGGTDLRESLKTHHGQRVPHCVILLSKTYLERRWPPFEADVLLDRARTALSDLLLLLSLDGTRLPGASEGHFHVASRCGKPTQPPSRSSTASDATCRLGGSGSRMGHSASGPRSGLLRTRSGSTTWGPL